LFLLGRPRAEERSSGCWWFSCWCVPKQPQQQQTQQKRSNEDETERTLDITEQGSDEDAGDAATTTTKQQSDGGGGVSAIMDPSDEMNTFLDAVDNDNDKEEEGQSNLVRTNSVASAVKPVATNLAHNILQALMGILMINYILDVFHHRQHPHQPQRIAAADDDGHDDKAKPKPPAAEQAKASAED